MSMAATVNPARASFNTASLKCGEPGRDRQLLDGAAALRKLLTGWGQYLFGCSDGSARRRQRQKQREAHGSDSLVWSGQPSRWATDGKTPCKVLQRVDGALSASFGADEGASRRARRARHGLGGTGTSRNSGSKSARRHCRDIYTRCGRPRHPRPQQAENCPFRKARQPEASF